MNRLQRHADRLGLALLRRLYLSALCRAIVRGDVAAQSPDTVVPLRYAGISGTTRIVNEDDGRPQARSEPVPVEMRKQAARVLKRELDEIPAQVRAYAEELLTETEVLTQRLARRFDLGAVLNEAHDRAKAKIDAERDRRLAEADKLEDPIAQHYARMRAEGPQLNHAQQQALAVQRAMLERNLRRA